MEEVPAPENAAGLSEAKRAIYALIARLRTCPDSKRDALERELADIVLYLFRFANRADVNLVDAAASKLIEEAARQPYLVTGAPEFDHELLEQPAIADGVSPLSILVVEDEQIVAADLQQTLQELGYDAYAVASSGETALAQARVRRPDLVLMDIRLRGAMDGIDTAARLQRDFGAAVIFITAHSDDATLERAKRIDPDGYLVKPVSTSALKATIRVVAHRHREG